MVRERLDDADGFVAACCRRRSRQGGSRTGRLLDERHQDQRDVVSADVAQWRDEIFYGRILAFGPVTEQMPRRTRLLLQRPLFERCDAGRCVTCVHINRSFRQSQKHVDQETRWMRRATYRDRGLKLSSRDGLDGRSTWPPSRAVSPCRFRAAESLGLLFSNNNRN